MASLSGFRIEQENSGQVQSNRDVNNSSENAYKASKGVEVEINGAVTDNLKLTFGATRYVAKDAHGDRTHPYIPQTSLKLFTRCALPMLSDLIAGEGN